MDSIDFSSQADYRRFSTRDSTESGPRIPHGGVTLNTTTDRGRQHLLAIERYERASSRPRVGRNGGCKGHHSGTPPKETSPRLHRTHGEHRRNIDGRRRGIRPSTSTDTERPERNIFTSYHDGRRPRAPDPARVGERDAMRRNQCSATRRDADAMRMVCEEAF